jgi:hypothetical protein
VSRYNATEINVGRVSSRYEDIGPYFTQVNSTFRPITTQLSIKISYHWLLTLHIEAPTAVEVFINLRAV